MSQINVTRVSSLQGNNSLSVDSNGTCDVTGNLRIKRWTNSTRPGSPQIGMIGFNTEEETAEVYDGTEWTGFGGSKIDGSSADKAAPSAAAILQVDPTAGDGVYWIDLPTVGATQVYCAMNSSHLGGGGWMLAWKCTRGNTFNYNNSYWTQANTYNATTQLNRNDGDHKNHVFNYYSGSTIGAVFPDLNNGGESSVPYNGWTWRQGLGGQTVLSRLQSQGQITGNPRGNRMWQGSGFSNQNGFQWYGFNYRGNGGNRVRWGFGWNNEGDQGSNDVSNGIGVQRSGASAGDHIYCCQGTTGVNRTIRAEIWVQ